MSRPVGSKNLNKLSMAQRVLLFWSHVDVREPEECWLWQAGINNNGYGQSLFRFEDGVTLRPAHRIAYRLAYGPFAEGAVICHRCDTPLCVNPKHLFAGTPADNMTDMAAKGRSARGERHNKAKVTEADVQEIRSLVNNGVRQTDVAKRFGLHRSTVCEIVHSATWKFVSQEVSR